LFFIWYMEKLKSLLNKYFWILPVLLVIPTGLALLKVGFFGASDDLHIAWLYEMEQAIRAGQFPPRFVPDLSFGFGYPLFNFVFPLPFYLGEILRIFHLSLVGSIKGVFFLGLIFSSLTMYLFLKNFLGKFMALAGSLVYAYAPYRSTEVYVRGAIGEALSFVFFPLISLAIVKIYDASVQGKRSWRWIGIGALSVVGLVISHDIAAYMFVPFACLLAVLFFAVVKDKLKYALSSISMFVLGLLGSIYFWLPALKDSSLMKYDTVYDFVNYFPTLKRLFTPYFGYGGFPTMSFFIGLVPIAVILFGGIFFLVKFKKFELKYKILLSWAAIILAVSMFMMNYRSIWAWNIIPFLPYFQFPWRFLMMVVFVAPIFLVGFSKLKKNIWIPVLISVFAIATTVSYFRPQDFFQERQDAYYLNRYIPYPKASEEYLKTSEEYLRLGINTKTRPEKVPSPVEFNGGVVGSFASTGHGLSVSVSVSSLNGGLLTYNKYYFPGWRATLDGNSVPINYGLSYGQIAINVPPGNHVLKIVFSETPFRIFLDITSLVFIIFSLMLILGNGKILFKNKK